MNYQVHTVQKESRIYKRLYQNIPQNDKLI